jgi:hypothetical protein
MTHHQYLHLTNQIAQLQNRMVNDFMLMIGFGGFCAILVVFAVRASNHDR